MLAWSLHERGYKVTECDDGYCLMKQLGLLGPLEKMHRYDLIVSGIRMSGATGMQILESVREFEDFPPVILITAFGDSDMHARAQKLGAVALLDKPFEIDDLLAEVGQVVQPCLTSRRKPLAPSKDKEPVVQFPVDIAFRHNRSSEPLRVYILKVGSKLNRYADRIMHCQVVIDESLAHCQREQEHHTSVTVNLSLPGETIVVKHHSDAVSGYENAYHAILVTFGKVSHQLRQHLDRHNSKRRHWKQKYYEQLSEDTNHET